MVKKLIKLIVIIFVVGIGIILFNEAISCSAKDYNYTKQEQQELWKKVELGNKFAARNLINYYMLHNFHTKTKTTIIKLMRMGIDKKDSSMCLSYGRFIVQHSVPNSSEYNDGINLLNIAKDNGNKEALELLERY